MGYNIKQVVSDNSSVTLKLENGVQVTISTRPDHLHLSFSGINYDEMLKLTPFANYDAAGKLEVANYFDVVYKSKNGD